MSVRSPAWSPDGSKVVYEKDVFDVPYPSMGKLAVTQKQLGNSSIVSMSPDGSQVKEVFDVFSANLTSSGIEQGLSSAF